MPGNSIPRLCRYQLCLPHCPSSPPSSPYGACCRCCASSVTCNGSRNCNFPNDPIATVEFAFSTRIFPDPEFQQPHRILAFQLLGIGNARVGHMLVHGRPAAESRTCAGSAANRFVITELVISEKKIIHRSLAASRESECFKQGIHQPLAHFRVAAHHGRTLSADRRKNRDAGSCFRAE